MPCTALPNRLRFSIPARNLHITLAFLGEVPESRLADVRSCMRDTSVTPFELVFGEMNFWRRQELLCIEPMESDRSGRSAIADLVERLNRALQARGFSIERREFRPHVTLARDVRQDHEFKPIRQLRWQVHRMELVASSASARGSEYTLI